MSYELPRAAKLKKEVQSKYIGRVGGRMHKAGKAVKVQRSPAEPSLFIVWFAKDEFAKVPALQLNDVIEYTDGRRVL